MSDETVTIEGRVFELALVDVADWRVIDGKCYYLREINQPQTCDRCAELMDTCAIMWGMIDKGWHPVELELMRVKMAELGIIAE